jgi:hypothetical protein
MDSSVLSKDEIWFLRVRHHISNAAYMLNALRVFYFPSSYLSIVNETGKITEAHYYVEIVCTLATPLPACCRLVQREIDKLRDNIVHGA